MIPKRFRFLCICLLAPIPGISSTAEKSPTNWRTECVGRMQISLPGEAEVAAMLPKDYIRYFRGKGNAPYKFPDGQSASWSNSEFMTITHPATLEERMEIDKMIDQRWRGAKDYATEISKETGRSYVLTELPKSEQIRMAWRGPDYYRAYLLVHDIAVWWAIDPQPDDMSNIAKDYQTLTTGLRYRPVFAIPKESGVCFPYLFVQDDGTAPRHVGSTYRLKDHPDITVWLQDATATVVLPNQDPDKFTAHYMAGFFWEQDYQNRRSFGSLWPGHQAFKPGTLAGYKGVKTFVELFRDDGTRDLGYLVAVRGNPKAKEDAPDLMLYVIQDSVNARKRGIEPLSQEAFFHLAETIAASVKRRETQSQ